MYTSQQLLPLFIVLQGYKWVSRFSILFLSRATLLFYFFVYGYPPYKKLRKIRKREMKKKKVEAEKKRKEEEEEEKAAELKKLTEELDKLKEEIKDLEKS